ncbi:MAG: hypothetical protein ABIU95_04155 [Burkholderiales bacterium]
MTQTTNHGDTGRAERPARWVVVLGWIALAIVLAAGFRAYLRPDMILELTNFILCL